MEYNGLMMMGILFIMICLFLYVLKRLLDAEAYRELTNKIVAYICKAEQEIVGVKKGEERLEAVVRSIGATASGREKRILQKLNAVSLVRGLFRGVVFPAILKRI